MNVGEVEIKLNGKVETLRPSLGAAKRVNAVGFNKTVGRIGEGDLDAYFLVVAAGLNKKTSEVEEAVYNTGLPTLAKSLIKFANILANGGKPFMPMKLKTVDIAGVTYAEVKLNGIGEPEPVYVPGEEPSGDENAGEA